MTRARTPTSPAELAGGTEVERSSEATHEAPSGEKLLDWHRTMLTARAIDDREVALYRQGKVFFLISGAGHEAVQVALAELVRPASDWFYFYYRDRAFALALGVSPTELLLQGIGAEADPASGGRQMPCHYGDARFNIVSASSPTGTQFLQAVGAAEAGLRAERDPALRARLATFAEDEIVVCTAGDGTTSEGEFWEALNTACNLKLPVLFLIEDNEYAISVPVEVQTAGGSISRLLAGFPHLGTWECDGTDMIDSHRAAAAAVEWCRARRGPALLHAHTVRPYSHSGSDDERAYRTRAELELQERRDPIRRGRELLLEIGAATGAELDRMAEEVASEVAAASDEALEYPQPAPETAMRWLYSESADPTSADFDTEDRPDFADDHPLTMVDLVNRCLRDEMERDSRIVVFGQDVADASREEALSEVTGKGGVFKATHGLQARFGGNRVYNAPLAEANIVGRAVGMAARGMRPVVEIQFVDYIWPAFMQIRNELATMRYRSAGDWAAPVVVRVTYGGYIKGGIYHSQTGATIFSHTAGLRVALPSNALDANGLLRTAIRSDDPVIFLEHKHLYRQVHNKSPYPGPGYMVPFGKAKVVRLGEDITVVACGAMVKRSWDAARAAAASHGIDAEVIDLRTISPLDMETIAASVRRTNKVIVAHEDALSWGIGSEVAARIADELFPWLDGPVRRVAALDTWVAYAPELEKAILPQTDDVLEALVELAAY
ncbi:MAG: dehydrogenase E1 component subunit alpha/beta [Gemmatimonadetes bacterium]|nr:dehydrogenase E1 component subunit alpha/beta [Gemmatimonadota bacterium]MCY3942154.1 dehydrogenase E1 component subunit alpha/beta [Gemmatimonadota bacterium]